MGKIIGLGFLGGLIFLGLMYVGTYNGFQRRDEGVSAAEREIASCYQKRADAITNLAATVERFASHERGVFNDVTQARASVGRIQLPDGATAAQIQEMSAAIQQQGSALTRLLAVSEAYPQLKSDQNFLQMQKDLKQVENQCNVLRNRYIRTVQAYNTSIRSFPSNIVANFHGYSTKEQIKFDNEEQNRQSPRVFQDTTKK